MKKILFLLLFFLPGCALQHQTMGPAVQAPELTENAFIASDSDNHALSRWTPDADPWAVVVALHGFNDYRMAFEKPGEFLAANGVLVLAYDQRGFGEDDRAGYWAEKEALKSDLQAVLALARAEYPGVPVFALGESMGGAVVLYALAGQENAADGLILVAPAVWGWTPTNILYRPGLWLTAHLMPGKKFRGKPLKLEPSDNIDMMIEMSEDPNVIKATRVDAIYGLSYLMKYGMKAAPDIRISTLMLYGDKDDLVPEKMFKKLWKKLPDNLSERTVYPDGYHLLLRDCGAEVVWRDLLNWLGKRSDHEVGEVTLVERQQCE